MQESHETNNAMKTLTLPDARVSGHISIEETLEKRRSIRNYSDTPLTLEEIGQLAWSAQGITESGRGFRTAPSAGATFPIEIYFFITGLNETPDGIYHYDPQYHSLTMIKRGDRRNDLHQSALFQDAIISAPVSMVISGVLQRTQQRYGDRALRYVHMEAGHVSQNVYLQATALDVGTVVIGAFNDDGVSKVMGFHDGEYPLYIMPLGKMD